MHIRALITALLATVILGVALGSASANRLATNDLNVYLIWNESSQPLTLEGTVEIVCHVTLLGSFHARTITKVLHSLIGHIVHASVESCSEPIRIIEADLPWHVTYEGFGGTLPRITALRLLLSNLALLFETDVGNCLIRADATPMAFEAIHEASGAITELNADPTPLIDFDDLAGSFFCDLASGSFVGNAAVENGEGADIDITLV